MTAAEFEARVTKLPSGCWVIGSPVLHRYSRLTVNGVRDRAHKVAVRIYKAPLRSFDKVLHYCHYRPCCNPDHLHVGTQADNAVDMMLANRQWSKRAKALTLDDVRSIVLAPGRVTDVATSLGFDYRTVFNIRTGRTWRKFAEEVRHGRHC